MTPARSSTTGAIARHLLIACFAVGVPAAIQQAAVSSVSGAPPPPRYRLTDLGTTGGYFIPWDVNEAGQVVGETLERNGALWKPTTLNGPDGAVTLVGAVSGIPLTVLHAINDSGVSGGEAYPSSQNGAGGNRAFLRSSGGQITTFPVDRAHIKDVNTAGVAVGAGLAGEYIGPVVFNGPAPGFLNPLGQWGWARSINDNGVIAGSVQFSYPHAARWVNGAFEDLHTLLPVEAYASDTAAINNLDHIVGMMQWNVGAPHGFLLSNGVRDLGTLAGLNCIPDDINDSDEIVGTAGLYTNSTVAFLDEGDGPVDLNALIAPGGDYHLARATGINNAGQIVGWATYAGTGNIRGVLLTPYTLIKADVSVTLAAAPSPVVAGHDLTYSGTVKNNGPQSASDVKATFTLPPDVELISTSPAATRDGDLLTFTLGTLNKQQSASIQVVVRPNSAGSLTARLYAAAPETDLAPLNNEAGKVVTVKSASVDLAVTGTDTPDPIVVGQVLTYKITVKNLGPDPASNARLVVPVDGLTSFQSVETTKGTASHQGSNAVAEIGALAKGESALVTVTMLAVTAGNLSSAAIATSDETDPNPSNSVLTLSTTIRSLSADVAVTGTDTPDPVTVGQTLTYKITVKNNGSDAASGVRMVVPLGSVQFVSVETTRGTASQQGSNVIAEVGALAKNETALITVSLTAQTPGDVVNGAIVTATESDPNPNNNLFNLATTINAAAQANLIGHWDKLEAKKKGQGKKLKYLVDATAKITNSGNAGAGASKLRFFLSTDRTKSKNDVPLTLKVNGNELPVEIPVNALAAGASQTIPVNGIKVSKKDFNAKLKGKYLLGVVDFAGTVPESDEADNVFPRKGDSVNPF